LEEFINPVETQTQTETIQVETKKRRTKKEMEEARQMGREDISSINLGLSQFNPTFKTNPISLMKPNASTSLLENEPTPVNVITPLTVATPNRKNTWDNLLQRYQVLTGTDFQRRKGYTKTQFQKLVEKMEQREDI